MIESFIILLREGIEVALIIGITLVYLHKINQAALIKSVYYGLFVAIATSAVAAALFRKYAVDHEYFEGYLLLAAAIFVATMIVIGATDPGATSMFATCALPSGETASIS